MSNKLPLPVFCSSTRASGSATAVATQNRLWTLLLTEFCLLPLARGKSRTAMAASK